METIAAARSFLDQQEALAIWYAAYDGSEESVVYANSKFCETFGLSMDDILEPESNFTDCCTAQHVYTGD